MKQKHILIVDDQVRVAFFLKEGLKGLGDEYQIFTIGSAEQALEKLAQQSFDLMVIDYRLPGINGLDLIERMQSISPHTLTILITAYSSKSIREEAYRLRAFHYLAKPFPLDDLIDTVQQALA